MKFKIVIITTHPIQYYAPFFQLLSKSSNIDLVVFYTWGNESLNKYDPDFQKKIIWDIPLLEGYNYSFTKNTSRKKGSHHFFGIINPNLIKEIKDVNPHAIWIWGWSFYSHLKVMHYFKGKIPIWFRGDSTLLDERPNFNIKKLLRFLWLKWVYSKVDLAFSVGTNNTAYLKRFGMKDAQIIKAPHAVDNLRFKQLSEQYNDLSIELRRKLLIGENQFVALFVGKFQSKKNPFFFVNVCNELKKNGLIGLMVGNGELEEEIKRNSKNVIFQDFQNQLRLPIYYRMADILIVPSVGPGETWGLVINEALASGLPVAASYKCGGAIDLINESNGFIFDPDDGIQSFIDKLMQFREQPKTDFYDEFNSEFNYQRILDSVLSILQ